MRKLGGINISSSVNPQELSLMITSVVKMGLSLLVAFGVMTTTGADTTLEQVPVLVTTGFATYQAVMACWGAIRKIMVAFSHKE